MSAAVTFHGWFAPSWATNAGLAEALRAASLTVNPRRSALMRTAADRLPIGPGYSPAGLRERILDAMSSADDLASAAVAVESMIEGLWADAVALDGAVIANLARRHAEAQADRRTLRAAVENALDEVGPMASARAVVAKSILYRALAETAADDGADPDDDDGWEGEHCQVCGRAYEIVYSVPYWIWATISPRPYAPRGGLLCLDCADARARSTGIPLVWTAASTATTHTHTPAT